MQTITIYVDVEGGCVQGIYGDALPTDIEINFVLRDHDNIEVGDEDPMPDGYVPECYYFWTMTEYIVLYRIKAISSDLDAPFGFECYARNVDDAEEQCLNNNPDADIVWVIQTESMREAFEDYYGTSIAA